MIINSENYFELNLNGEDHKIPVFPLSTQKVIELAEYEDLLSPLYEKFAQGGLSEKEQGETGLKAAKIFESIWNICVIDYESTWKKVFALIPITHSRDVFFELISIMNGVKKNTPQPSPKSQDSKVKLNSGKRGLRKKK